MYVQHSSSPPSPNAVNGLESLPVGLDRHQGTTRVSQLPACAGAGTCSPLARYCGPCGVAAQTGVYRPKYPDEGFKATNQRFLPVTDILAPVLFFARPSPPPTPGADPHWRAACRQGCRLAVGVPRVLQCTLCT